MWAGFRSSKKSDKGKGRSKDSNGGSDYVLVEGRHSLGATAAGTQSTDILVALTEFIRPIIREYASHQDSDTAHKFSPLAHNTNHAKILASKGDKLVNALTEFVAASVQSMHYPLSTVSKNTEKMYMEPGNNSVESLSGYEILTGSVNVENPDKTQGLTESTTEDNGEKQDYAPAVTSLVDQVPQTELDREVLTAARAHVFNKMPIRLLAFDSSGSQIQLIDRGIIFQMILPNVFEEVSKPEFQSEWTKAQELRDHFTWTMTYKRDKIREILGSLIDRSARYAILSHTWIRDTPGDVTYQEWIANMVDRNGLGFEKIANFCKISAQKHGMTLGWVDSVCINKESSSELDESIRSMYHWYRGSNIAITYLSETSVIQEGSYDTWFTRGWTLQELLAPTKVIFYNRNWQELGSSLDPAILSLIEKATTIKKRELDLCRAGNIQKIPISRRLQMACGRNVTREEDTSYSLMGILGSDISVAYGEGSERAFHRLVREILTTQKHIIDIFNHSYKQSDPLLPSSINNYATRTNAFDYTGWGTHLHDHHPFKPVVVTHRGVRVSFILIPAYLILRNTEDTQYQSFGDFSTTPIDANLIIMGSSKTVPITYRTLDRRLYHGENSDTIPLLDKDSLEKTGMTGYTCFGMFHFGYDGFGNILLNPDKSGGSVRFDGPGLKPGYMLPSNSSGLSIGGKDTLYKITLTSATNKYTIPKDDLEKHGLKLVTWYM